ncbi:MAG: glycosyltransferase family 2 protein [Isosphaeraceae bacterium]
MDDVPAGPASPGPRRPSLSVVVPVRNGGAVLEHCLLRLRNSTWTDFELIVVDDGSSDSSGDLARRMGAVVVDHERPLGPAAARNRGAQIARAPIIFFLDADVAVHPDAVARGMARFLAQPGLTAVFGSYDDRPAAPGIPSQFRNLLHHFVHQQGAFVDDARRAHTFWTGCGLIRRETFLEFGGFDPLLYPRPAIEDIELGYRLTRAGHTILLARDIQGTHHKRWSLTGMIRTDIFCRGVPWMLLLKRSGTEETDLNVSPAQRISVALTAVVLLGLPASTLSTAATAVTLLALAAIVGINQAFYRFLLERRGAAFAAASLPWPLRYFTCCGLSVMIALFQWHILRPLSASTARRAARRDGVFHRAESIPRPFLTRLSGRLSRWTSRSR